MAVFAQLTASRLTQTCLTKGILGKLCLLTHANAATCQILDHLHMQHIPRLQVSRYGACILSMQQARTQL